MVASGWSLLDTAIVFCLDAKVAADGVAGHDLAALTGFVVPFGQFRRGAAASAFHLPDVHGRRAGVGEAETGFEHVGSGVGLQVDGVRVPRSIPRG